MKPSTSRLALTRPARRSLRSQKTSDAKTPSQRASHHRRAQGRSHPPAPRPDLGQVGELAQSGLALLAARDQGPTRRGWPSAGRDPAVSSGQGGEPKRMPPSDSAGVRSVRRLRGDHAHAAPSPAASSRARRNSPRNRPAAAGPSRPSGRRAHCRPRRRRPVRRSVRPAPAWRSRSRRRSAVASPAGPGRSTRPGRCRQ